MLVKITFDLLALLGGPTLTVYGKFICALIYMENFQQIARSR